MKNENDKICNLIINIKERKKLEPLRNKPNLSVFIFINIII